MKILSFNVLCYGCDGHSWLDRDADVIATVRNYMPDGSHRLDGRFP